MERPKLSLSGEPKGTKEGKRKILLTQIAFKGSVCCASFSCTLKLKPNLADSVWQSLVHGYSFHCSSPYNHGMFLQKEDVSVGFSLCNCFTSHPLTIWGWSFYAEAYGYNQIQETAQSANPNAAHGTTPCESCRLFFAGQSGLNASFCAPSPQSQLPGSLSASCIC